MICASCKKKPATEYYSGRHLCDVCYLIRREKQRAYARAYYHKHKKYFRGYQREYQKKHGNRVLPLEEPPPIKTHYNASNLMRLSVEKFEFVVKMMAKRKYFYIPRRRKNHEATPNR